MGPRVTCTPEGESESDLGEKDSLSRLGADRADERVPRSTTTVGSASARLGRQTGTPAVRRPHRLVPNLAHGFPGMEKLSILLFMPEIIHPPPPPGPQDKPQLLVPAFKACAPLPLPSAAALGHGPDLCRGCVLTRITLPLPHLVFLAKLISEGSFK